MNPGAVTIILEDAAQRGITLQARAGKVRFRPRSAMTPDLAEQIKAHRHSNFRRRRRRGRAMIRHKINQRRIRLMPHGGNQRNV